MKFGFTVGAVIDRAYRRQLWLILAGAILLLAAIAAPLTDAHKPITSKYTYNDDVFPIFRERCGACHVAGGAAPMSLMTYKDAIPWAESMRIELTAGHMPPWFADPGFSDIRNPHRLSPRELDILLTWATGGVPEGPAKRLPGITLQNAWRLGAPDLTIPLPSTFTLGEDKKEGAAEFVLGHADADRWIRAADLLPGTPSVVRSATITTSTGSVVAEWLPGDDSAQTPEGAAFLWAKGDTLSVRIHYVKPWTAEGKVVSDRSAVGLYFTVAPQREIRTVRAVDRNLQVLAVEVEEGGSDKELKVEAVRPDGVRTPLIRLLERPDWRRRYWLVRPLTLPAGTRIAVSGDPAAHVLLDVAFAH